MSDLTIELCPETGVCSILRPDKSKVDLMPTEVADLREAKGDFAALREAIGEADEDFAANLSEDQLRQIAERVSK